MFPDMYSWFGKHESLSAKDRLEIEGAFQAARTAKSSTDFNQAYQRTLDTASLMGNAYRRHEKHWQAVWGNQGSYRARCLANAEKFREMLLLHTRSQEGKGHFSEPYNLRERVNADNLLWLLDDKFRGKKLIVWAHNVHIFKGRPAGGIGISAPASPLLLDSTGRIVAARLGNDVFSIGFIANEGEWSWLGGKPIKFGSVNPNSWESRLAQLRSPLAFADLRREPTGDPLEATINQQQPLTMTGDWRKGFDAFLYIHKMKPRTEIPSL